MSAETRLDGPGPSVAAPTGTERRTWTRWDAAALMTLAVGLLLRAYLLSQAWFWQDDFAHTERALRSPLDGAWLLQDYNGHLKPAFFLQAWLLSHTVGNSWAVTSAIILAWSAALGLGMWFMVTGMFGRGPAALLALALGYLTPLWAVTTSWYASAMESLTTLTLGVFATGCAVRLASTGARRWGVGSVACYVAALLWYEKALLTLILLGFGLAIMLYQRRASGLRTRAAALTGLAFALTSVAYVTAYLLRVGLPSGSAGDSAGVGRLVYEMVLSVIPTGLLGGPWQQNADGSTLQVIITQPWLLWIWVACAVVFAVGWARNRSSAALALAGVLAGVLPLVLLVARARLDFFGPVIGRDTRYAVDLIPFAALALGLLIAGGVKAASPRLGPLPRRVLVTAAPALVLIYAMVAWPSYYAVAASRASVGAQEWVAAAVTSMERHPERTVVNGVAPRRIVSPAFGTSARMAPLLGTFGVSRDRFDAIDAEWWRLTEQGSMEPALFVPLRVLIDPADAECPLSVAGDPVRVTLPATPVPPGSGVPAVRIGWFASRALTVVLQSDGERWEVPLTGGLGYVLVPTASLGSDIIIGGLGPDEEFCVTGVEIGVAG